MLKKQLLEKAEQENSFYPLSYGQRALFFLYLNSPESSSYNVAFTARILSEIDLDSLRKAFQKLINRHPVLRTTFLFKDGKPVQEVHVYREISLEEIDAKGLNEEQLYQKVKEAYSIPFDLENGPVFRVHLFKIKEENNILLINMHHIVSDGWSLGIILNELGSLYQTESTGNSNSLPKLQTTYFDYLKKHEEMLSSTKGEELWSYWKEELSGSNTKLDLPYDRQRPESPTTDGSMVYISIDNELISGLRAFAKSEGVTIYNLLLTAYLVLLHKYSNQNDILIGTTTAGRNIPDTKDIAGYFVNPVVIRGNFSEETSFKSFLSKTRKTVLGALENQDFPFSMLVEKLMPVREPGLSPVFQAEFGLYKIQTGNDILHLMSAGSKGKQVMWGNLKAEYYELRQQEGQFDLLLELQETDDRISGYLKYSTDVFEQYTISKMAERYKNLLKNILKNPDRKISELNLILNEEKDLILRQWNDTKANYPSHYTIHELFEKQSKTFPGNTAVVFGDKILKYSDLKKDSGLLANYLRNEYKVNRNDLICVLMDKSEYMIVTLLAILKAGGAYVPVDPDYPQERINYILVNCKSKIIISNSEHINKIRKEYNGAVIDSEMIEQKLKNESPVEISNINEPDDTAYIIYTSGTTGNPKGCIISHRNVVRLMVNDKMPFEFSEKDVWIMAHSFCFDFSVWEMYGALLYGGKLIVPVKDDVRVITDFLSLVKEHKVTVLNQTPPAFYNLISEERNSGDRNLDSHLRYVIFGGDKLEPAKLKDWCTAYSLNKTQLINMYGITETTVHVTFYRLKESDISSLRSRSPIGKPIPETTVYVFDKYFNLLPPGIRGEFYVGGTGVSKGYLFNDELTAQRFINNPIIPEEIIYKTGDEGYWLPDGNLVYSGRIDNQVKIRGFRIELGEIENSILNFGNIREAVVLAREEKSGDKRLIAYIVFDKAAASSNDLREYLKNKLPDYMVPSAFVFLNEMPMTPNGKVDKKALTEKELTRNDLESIFVSPESSDEKILAGIWQEILGIDKVGVNDNFFELGGDSIISIQIIARAAQEGMKITPKQMFKYQTIAQLSSVLDNELIHPEVNQGAVTGVINLTPVQHWFFEQNLPEPDHFNHSVLLKVPKELNEGFLKEAVKELIKHHDALRLKFILDDSGWIQSNEGLSGQVPFSIADLSHINSADLNKAFEENVSGLQEIISLSEGKLINVRLYKTSDEEYDRLFITVHHLCTDGISWRILLEDLYNAYRQKSNGERIKLPPKTNSFKDWSDSLTGYSESENISKEKGFWLKPADEIFAPMYRDLHADNSQNTVESNDTAVIELDELKTQSLLKDVPKAYNTQINDILLAALVIAYNKLTYEYSLFINLEGHGREEIFEGVDVSRTVGWFTSIYPVVLKLYDKNNIGETIKSTKEILREIPDGGVGFGVLRYLSKDKETRKKIKSIPDPEISFNYLGQFNENISSGSGWKLGNSFIILSQNKSGTRAHLIEINGIITGNKLRVYFNYSKNIHKRQTIISFAEFYQEALENVIEHCTSESTGGFTPSDFSTSGLNQQELDNLLANLN